MFARDLHLPALAEGDLVALWPAGAYGAWRKGAPTDKPSSEGGL